jgi:hypothetical protein
LVSWSFLLSASLGKADERVEQEARTLGEIARDAAIFPDPQRPKLVDEISE